ncbi:CHAT domain-containing protein [Mycena vulgaris]|nr:CHAT domain-containing protein [Mycena vulgaris]
MTTQAAPISDGSGDEWVTESESTDSHMSDGQSDEGILDPEIIPRIQQLIQQTPRDHPDLLKHQQVLGMMFQERYSVSEDIKDLEAAMQNFQAAVDLSKELKHPRQAECLANLAVVFTDRYQRFRDLKDLEEALKYDQQAVELTPKEDPDRAGRLQNLAVSFTDRYHMLGELKDLETALEKLEEAVKLIPEGDPDRVECLKGLGLSFRDRYQKLGELKDLEAAMQRSQEAVNLTQDHPNRAEYLANLAALFTDKYQRFGGLKDLETALEIENKVVNLTDGDPNMGEHLKSLGILFRHRYERFGELKDLEAALQRFQEAQDLPLQEDLDRAEHLQNLAVTYGDRYKRLGNLNDLEFMVQKLQEAVTLMPEGHPNLGVCMQNLAAASGDRYHRLGEVKDLETALELDQKAREIISDGHSETAAQLYQLAVSFRDQYQRSGDLQILENALDNGRQALELTPEEHLHRPKRLQTFAMSLRDRYQKLGDLKDLETALPTFQQAVNLTPEGHPEKPLHLHSLAIAFTDRYQRLREMTDLQMALQAEQEALNLIPEGHPERAGYLQGLAMSFRDFYMRSEDLKDLKLALQRFQEAVDLTPEGHPARAERFHNLAVSLRHQYNKLQDSKYLDSALILGQKAVKLTPKGHPDLAERLQDLALSFRARYAQFREPADLAAIQSCYKDSFESPPFNPQDSWKAALDWASFAEEFQPSDCLTAYLAAFHLLPDLLWIGHTIPVRHDALRVLDIGQATSAAVKTCISLNNLTSAIEIMEQGLATIFQQTLQLKTDVDQLPQDQANEFSALSAQLYTGTSAHQRQAAIKRAELLQKIHQQPGLASFLLPKSYDILQHASKGGPVLILNSDEDYCDGIIILNPTSQPVHVPLPDITYEMLQSKRAILKDLLGRCNVRNRGESTSSRLFGRKAWFTSKSVEESFADLLTWLWTYIVAPVYQVLELHRIHNGRLWWLPTGAFTGLPLHASPPTTQFIHSYTTTLGSLSDAYTKKSPSTTPKFGIVGVTHTGPGGMDSLKGVEEEIKRILPVIKSPVECLQGEHATSDAVKLQLQSCSWIHLACHGKQELVDPAKSYLKLYGGILELDTILRLPLSNAEFVFLAACQTVMGDTELVNESFHLGGGFMTAGFRGVIGTLWSMNDQDGPLVAEMVYSHLFRNGRQPQASDAAEALQGAVEKLKARKVPYERWIPFIHMGI